MKYEEYVNHIAVEFCKVVGGDNVVWIDAPFDSVTTNIEDAQEELETKNMYEMDIGVNTKSMPDSRIDRLFDDIEKFVQENGIEYENVSINSQNSVFRLYLHSNAIGGSENLGRKN